ncbi:sugar ABC transporter substrate-binding protein [Nocardia africana]
MSNTRRKLIALGLGICCVLSAAGCAGESSSSSGGGTGLQGKKIGVLVTSMQSESEARFAQDTAKAAGILGWKTDIKDGQNNPQVWAQQAQQLVSSKVDAIITIGIDAPTITQALQSAKSASIPVIATNVSVAPTGKDLFSAVYSDDDVALGKTLAGYAIEKSPGAKAVGQTATAVYAADQLVQAAKAEIAAKGGTMAEVQDVDVTNLASSFGGTTVSLVQGHPDAKYLVSCCDFAPAIDLPALQQVGNTNVTLLTRYDNDSSLEAIRRGAKLAIVATNSERTNLQALDVLAAFFAKGTPIPAAYPGDKFETTMVDASNVPPAGSVYPFQTLQAPFEQKWTSEYKING